MKSLHGIMNITSSSYRLAKRSNKVGISDTVADKDKDGSSDQ
jgi:hypothetical protein